MLNGLGADLRSQADSILGMSNLLSGGGIHRLAIFALGLVPYVSAAVLAQLLTIIKRLRAPWTGASAAAALWLYPEP